MNKKLLWFSLIILQIPIYLFFTGFQNIRPSNYLFVIALSISAGISYTLAYMYRNFRNKGEINRIKIFFNFLISSVLYGIFMTFFVLILGNLLLILSLAWFTFTIIFFGIVYIFKKSYESNEVK